MSTPHIQLILDDRPIPGALRTALGRLNARVSIRSVEKALASGLSPSADVCVIVPGRNGPPDIMDHLLAEARGQACATLVMPHAAEIPTDRSNATGDFDIPFDNHRNTADELAGRIQALCEIRRPMLRMRQELAELKRRDAELVSDSKALTEQIHLASQIQRDLLPPPLQDTEPFAIHTLFLPADHVSGDIYDFSRIDEHLFGFSLADATGHGLPAALLTILIKNSLAANKVIHHDTYRIVEPDELLGRLNMELLQANLSQCQFITALNAILDHHTRQVRWARAGLPYPILLRPGQPPRQIHSDGGLLGALPDQTFEIVHHSFKPGDVLLFFSDGIETLLLDRPGGSDKSILHTPWLNQLADTGPALALDDLRGRLRRKNTGPWPIDDITLIAISMNL